MTPTLGVGDVIFEQRVAPPQVKIGDVITFPAPDHKGKTFTHRVVSIKLQPNGRVAFVTQGDANPSTESWAVKADGTLGLARFRIGKLGYITNRAGSRMGRLALIVIPVLLLGIYEFRRIWSHDDDDEADDAASG
jgi:signal peptidase